MPVSLMPLPRTYVEPDDAELHESGLNRDQLRAVDALAHRTFGQTLQSIADDAGCCRMSLYRWMRLPEFVQAVRTSVEARLGMHRGEVAGALLDGAAIPGAGQSSMQRLYWQLLGDLTEKSEVTGPGGGPIQVATIDITKLTDAELERAHKDLVSRGLLKGKA